MVLELVIFILVQLLNVISGTLKYVCTVKSTPTVAAIVNAVSYTLGAILTLIIVQQEMWIVIIVTFICNLIGVPIGKWLVNKFSKDRLWIFTATIECSTAMAASLRKKWKDKFGIHSNFQSIVDNELYTFSIYSKTTADSKIIKDELTKLNAHYHITEAL